MAELSEKEKAFAATNDPMLSDMTVILGGREFPILNLKYRKLKVFSALLLPLMESFAGKIVGIDADMTAAALMMKCGDVLPQLAQISLSASDPSITVQDIEDMENVSPFALATVVLKQIQRNEMMGQIVDFFKQLLPLMKMAKLAGKTSSK